MKTKPLGSRQLQSFENFLSRPPELESFIKEMDKHLDAALLSKVDVMGLTIAFGKVEHRL